MDIGGVDDAGALGLGQDEVQEEQESDILVERYPNRDGSSERECSLRSSTRGSEERTRQGANQSSSPRGERRPAPPST